MARNFQEIRKAVNERERCLREAFENEIKGRYGYFKDELVELERRLKIVADLEKEVKDLMNEFERTDSANVVAGLPRVQALDKRGNEVEEGLRAWRSV